jgi:hypothetical protein
MLKYLPASVNAIPTPITHVPYKSTSKNLPLRCAFCELCAKKNIQLSPIGRGDRCIDAYSKTQRLKRTRRPFVPGKSPAEALVQHPGPSLLLKSKSIVTEWSGLRVGIHILGFTYVEEARARKIHLHNGTRRQLSPADTQKSASSACSDMGLFAPHCRFSTLLYPMMTPKRLLKSCAMPPDSRPMASIFFAIRESLPRTSSRTSPL